MSKPRLLSAPRLASGERRVPRSESLDPVMDETITEMAKQMGVTKSYLKQQMFYHFLNMSEPAYVSEGKRKRRKR